MKVLDHSARASSAVRLIAREHQHDEYYTNGAGDAGVGSTSCWEGGA